MEESYGGLLSISQITIIDPIHHWEPYCAAGRHYFEVLINGIAKEDAVCTFLAMVTTFRFSLSAASCVSPLGFLWISRSLWHLRRGDIDTNTCSVGDKDECTES